MSLTSYRAAPPRVGFDIALGALDDLVAMAGRLHPVLPFPGLRGFGDTCRGRPIFFGGSAGVQVLDFACASCSSVVRAIHADAGGAGGEWMIAAHDGKSLPQRGSGFRRTWARWFDFVVSSLSGD